MNKSVNNQHRECHRYLMMYEINEYRNEQIIVMSKRFYISSAWQRLYVPSYLPYINEQWKEEVEEWTDL